MKHFVLAIAISYLVAGWASMDFNPSLKRAEIRQVGGQPQIVWISDREAEVSYFEVRRKKGGDPTFRSISEDISARGPGTTYAFVDDDLYKSTAELIEYCVFAVSSSGDEHQFAILHFNYAPTAVRRTWGSIKAMFQ